MSCYGMLQQQINTEVIFRREILEVTHKFSKLYKIQNSMDQQLNAQEVLICLKYWYAINRGMKQNA